MVKILEVTHIKYSPTTAHRVVIAMMLDCRLTDSGAVSHLKLECVPSRPQHPVIMSTPLTPQMSKSLSLASFYSSDNLECVFICCFKQPVNQLVCNISEDTDRQDMTRYDMTRHDTTQNDTKGLREVELLIKRDERITMTESSHAVYH